MLFVDFVIHEFILAGRANHGFILAGRANHGFIPAGRANHYMSCLKAGSIVKSIILRLQGAQAYTR